MYKPLIKIAYRQVIDIHSKGSFERNVFEDSYLEFLMQAQAYNRDNKFTSFEQLISNNPKANSLHYKVGFAIGLYVQSLQNQVKISRDKGIVFQLPFELHEFEIVRSDISDKAAHTVAITYKTGVCTLLQVTGDYLLLSTGDHHCDEEWQETFLVKPGETISIFNYQEKKLPLVAVNN